MFAVAPWVLLITGPAVAQDGFDAHGFHLVAHEADLRDPLTLHRPDEFEQGDWWGSGLLEYARAPLIEQSEQTGERRPLLDHVVAANLSLGGAVHDQLRFELAWPLFLTSVGDGGTPQGVGVGDLRLAALGAINDSDAAGGWGLGLSPYVDLPAGNDGEFLGQRTIAGGLVLSGTREIDRGTLGANAGVQFNPSVEQSNISGADQVILGLHGGYLFEERTGANLELRALLDVQRNAKVGTGSPAEVIASVRHAPSEGPFFTGGLATALTPGMGAAAFRVLLGGGWGDHGAPGPEDRDGDGFVDRLDACPDVPETENDWQDDDGCPDQLPLLGVEVVYQGQPVDQADVTVWHDGVTEQWTYTGQPVVRETQPGILWTVEARSGACLSGRSEMVTEEGESSLVVTLEPERLRSLSVRVVDEAQIPVPGVWVSHTASERACAPDGSMVADSSGRAARRVGPGTHSVAVSPAGYEPAEAQIEVSADVDPDEVVLVLRTSAVMAEPQTIQVNRPPAPEPPPPKVRVVLQPDRIAILEPVHFETGRDEIKPMSFGILDEVADLIKTSPEVGKVTVAGHTDSQGTEESNLALSQRRAEAVVNYLVEAGVGRDQLRAKGYGESVPVAPNRTPVGRAKNRRVEFELESR